MEHILTLKKGKGGFDKKDIFQLQKDADRKHFLFKCVDTLSMIVAFVTKCRCIYEGICYKQPNIKHSSCSNYSEIRCKPIK